MNWLNCNIQSILHFHFVLSSGRKVWIFKTPLTIETNKKVQMKSKIEQALDETKKANADISSIKNLIRESGILIQNISKIAALVGIVTHIKTLLGF